jgi:hypothetical protein
VFAFDISTLEVVREVTGFKASSCCTGLLRDSRIDDQGQLQRFFQRLLADTRIRFPELSKSPGLNGPLNNHEISGVGLEPWLDAFGGSRIRVLREFPYLYDGTLDYERAYLGLSQRSECSRIVLVTAANGGLIGATICVPLADEVEEFQKPFLAAGLGVEDCLYFGESIVLYEWHGFGLGKEFFGRR